MTRRRSQHPKAIESRKRRKAYRRKLIKILGGRCDKCGVTKKLEPHHKTPRTWKSHERWAMSRLLIYLREAAAGKLGLLCRGCNAALNFPQTGDDSEF